jgi:hypothetical protein
MIVVEGVLNQKLDLRLAVDTGCSHSTFDLNALLLANISLKNVIDRVAVETTNGLIYADILIIDELKVFDFTFKKMPIQVIDFVAHGVISDYDALLGLDFLRNKNLCIHFVDRFLTFK